MILGNGQIHIEIFKNEWNEIETTAHHTGLFFLYTTGYVFAFQTTRQGGTSTFFQDSRYKNWNEAAVAK